jgi:hypothetical protein
MLPKKLLERKLHGAIQHAGARPAQQEESLLETDQR